MLYVFNAFKIWTVLLLSLIVLLVVLLLDRPAVSEIDDAPGASDKCVILSDSVEIVDTASDHILNSRELEGTLSITESNDSSPDIDLSPTAPSITNNLEAERGPFAPSEALKVQESFKVDPPMRSIGQAWKAERKISNFTMPVSEGRDLEIQVERFESMGEEGGEFIGTVIGAPGSTVRLSYRGTAEAGRIDIPSEGRSYQILPGRDGEIIVQDRNPSLEAQTGALFPPVGIELPSVPEFIPPPPPSGIFDAIPPFMPIP